MPQQPAANPVKVYISYSHQDEALTDELIKHLTPLQQRRMVDLFYDHLLEPRADLSNELRERLAEAEIFLFVVSPAALTSEFMEEELSTALALLQSGGLAIVPVLLRPCDWTGSRLARFQALPTDGRPVTSWPNRDEAFLAIVRGIRQIVESRLASRRQAGTEATPGLVRMQGGHRGAVTSIAVTADGEYAISGSEDATVIVWDLKSLRALRTMEGHTGPVRHVSMVPSSDVILSASTDENARLWDLRTGRVLRLLEGHSGPITAAAASNDNLAVTGSEDNTVRIWDVATGRLLRTITSRVRAIAALPDRRSFITADFNQPTLAHRNPQNPEQILTTIAVRNIDDTAVGIGVKVDASVHQIAVTPESRAALLACEDQTIRVLDLRNGKEALKLEHGTNVLAMDVLPDGRRAVSAAADGSIRIWDIQSGAELGKFETGDSSLSTFALIPNSSRLVCGSSTGAVSLFSLEAPRPRQLPVGIDRLRLAYLAVLEDPKLFPMLETFEESELAAIADRLERLSGAGSTAAPPPLWSAWMQMVHAAKLGSPDRP